MNILIRLCWLIRLSQRKENFEEVGRGWVMNLKIAVKDWDRRGLGAV